LKIRICLGFGACNSGSKAGLPMTSAKAQITNIYVMAGFIPASLPVFASPDLSGRSNLGGDDFCGLILRGECQDLSHPHKFSHFAL
jgi:hypothetical protein